MKKLLVVLAAAALVCAFTVPAMAAADWNFYGSARMATFVQTDDPGTPGSDTDSDTQWDLQGNSRIGANVDAGDIKGRFEYGSGPNLRLLYGTYEFDGGKINVGQKYTPITSFYSNQVWNADEDLLDFGQPYAGRQPMLEFESAAGFKVALIRPNASDDLGLAGGDIDVLLPKVELSYNLAQEAFFMDVYAGFQTYAIEVGTKDYDVDSYLAGIGGGVNMGPAFFKANIYYAQNAGNYGLAGSAANSNQQSSAGFNAAKNEVVDCETLGYFALAGFKANDMLTFEAGYGGVTHELDVDNAESDDTWTAYVNATINIADGFFVVPEVGFINREEDNAKNEQGDFTYYGAKWQINF